MVPLLRRRGLFRTHYAEATLRERYGLDPVDSPLFDELEPVAHAS